MQREIQIHAWPNVLGLDAALIAVAWQQVFADATDCELGWTAGLVLGFSVWLTYLADRLFDVSKRHGDALLSIRHQFAKRHNHMLWHIWFPVLAIDIFLAYFGLSAEQFFRGLLLLALCLLYTGLNRLLSKRFFPKEILVALIFVGGTVVFLEELPPLAAVTAFTLLCLINCLGIAYRETEFDDAMRVRSLTSVLSDKWLILLFVSAAIFSALTSAASLALLSCLIPMLVLSRLSQTIEREAFRVYMDASLLFGPPSIFSRTHFSGSACA